jgi:hypothetical protein
VVPSCGSAAVQLNIPQIPNSQQFPISQIPNPPYLRMDAFFNHHMNNGGHHGVLHNTSAAAASTNQSPRMPPNTSEKQFKCDFCEKSFTQRRNLRAHIRTVHEKLKPYQCTHCGLTANRKFNLLSHIKKMHGATTADTAIVDTRLSSGVSAAAASSSTTTGGSTSQQQQQHGTNPSTHKTAKKTEPQPGGQHHGQQHHGQQQQQQHQHQQQHPQQCLVCLSPVKPVPNVTKYFCDKCDQRFTSSGHEVKPAVNSAANAASAAAANNYLCNVQGRNFNANSKHNQQAFRCLQCPYYTEDSSAMIGHHLQAHATYMPM